MSGARSSADDPAEESILRQLMILVFACCACGCGGEIVADDGGVDADRNAGVPFADIQYATRCDATLGCPGVMLRDICGFSGSDACEGFFDEAEVSCAVSSDGALRTIDFSASQGGDFSIEIAGLQVPLAGGGASGAGCSVTLVEGADVYTGACGSSAPSETQPCQISDVRFTERAGTPQVEGDFFCQFLTNSADPNLQIEVTGISGGATWPGRFRLANCPGLTL